MAGSSQFEDGEPHFQIAPMVDVIFVLLIFFMACAAAKQVKKIELEASLPVPGVAHGSLPVVVDIGIAGDGHVTMNDQPFGEPGDKKLAQLRQWFLDAHERFGSNDPVLLHPAPDAVQERIMDVLNACVAAKVPTIAFR